MFWGFLILSALGLTFVNWAVIPSGWLFFSTGLKMALGVIAVLGALLIWSKYSKKEDKVISVKPRSLP